MGMALCVHLWSCWLTEDWVPCPISVIATESVCRVNSLMQCLLGHPKGVQSNLEKSYSVAELYLMYLNAFGSYLKKCAIQNSFYGVWCSQAINIP